MAYPPPIPGQEYTDEDRFAGENHAAPIPGQEYAWEKESAGKRSVSPAVIGVAIGAIAIVIIAAVAAAIHFGNMAGDSDTEQGEASGIESSGSSATDSSGSDGDSHSSSALGYDGESNSAESSESSSGSDEQAVSVPIVDGSGPSDSAASDYYTFENESVRITMPSSYASEGYYWSNTSSETVTMKRNDGAVMCMIIWGTAASHESEAKSESHIIGEVSHGSIGFPAFLRINYLDEQGKSIYWGSSDTGTLATDLLGADVQEIVSWIELYSNGFRPASLSPQDPESDSGGFVTPLTEPFYGVWVSATKDYEEARDIAASTHVGGGVGLVFLTTDWENLNDEPWYVVAAGYAQTESEAQALCDRAHEAGYTDAYVKYSGAYIGPS